MIYDLDHSCIAQWLQQHGQLVSHLTVEVLVSKDRLNLKDFSKAAAPCASIDLTVRHSEFLVVDLAELQPVAGSLQCLNLPSRDESCGRVRGVSAFSSMSRLTVLQLEYEEFENEEPWGMLAKLTSLQKLSLVVRAGGDPSPLSALTGLTYLKLESIFHEFDRLVPFTFSSLQPLSTLQHLEVLDLRSHACAATSLQGLAGLSYLKVLNLSLDDIGGWLTNLEGISAVLKEFLLENARYSVSLAGIEACTCLEKLSLIYCDVSSLQPVQSLSSLKELVVYDGELTSLESLKSMSLQSLRLTSCYSLTLMSGVEHLPALKSLRVMGCGVTSLQPLSELGKELQMLEVYDCRHVQEEVLELPHVQPTADVVVKRSNVREVVFAGGVRRAVGQEG
jgi:hypothetical protein